MAWQPDQNPRGRRYPALQACQDAGLSVDRLFEIKISIHRFSSIGVESRIGHRTKYRKGEGRRI